MEEYITDRPIENTWEDRFHRADFASGDAEAPVIRQFLTCHRAAAEHRPAPEEEISRN